MVADLLPFPEARLTSLFGQKTGWVPLFFSLPEHFRHRSLQFDGGRKQQQCMCAEAFFLSGFQISHVNNGVDDSQKRYFSLESNKTPLHSWIGLDILCLVLFTFSFINPHSLVIVSGHIAAAPINDAAVGTWHHKFLV